MFKSASKIWNEVLKMLFNSAESIWDNCDNIVKRDFQIFWLGFNFGKNIQAGLLVFYKYIYIIFHVWNWPETLQSMFQVYMTSCLQNSLKILGLVRYFECLCETKLLIFLQKKIDFPEKKYSWKKFWWQEGNSIWKTSPSQLPCQHLPAQC